ncbi:MAG: DUF6263 family protein [Phycisphaerales bacterium]
MSGSTIVRRISRLTPGKSKAAIALAFAWMILQPQFFSAAAYAQQDSKKTAVTQEVDLRPKWRKGQETRFDMSLDIVSEQNLNAVKGGDEPEPMKQVIKQKIGLLLRVKEVASSGAATVDLVYESLKFDADSALGKISFDSSQTKNDKDEFDGLLRSIIGLTMTLQLDENGNITNISSSGGGGMAGGMLQQFTAADLVKGMFGPIMTIKAGNGRAKVGERWTNESSMSGQMGTTKIKNEYTLESAAGSMARMNIQGTVSLDGGTTGMANIREGSITGKATWNTERGMLESMNMTQRLMVDTHSTGEAAGTTRNTMTMSVTRKN